MSAATAEAPADRLAALAAAVDAVMAVRVDGLDEPAVRTELQALETETRRLSARTTRLAGALAARQAARLEQGTERNTGRARDRAARDVRQELTGRLGWKPSKAARALRTGRRLEGTPRTQAAFDAGRVDADQARVITDTLLHLCGEVRDEVERRLLDAAATEHAVELGKTARRLLAQVDPAAALDDADRRHARRWARVAPTDTGMLAVHGELAGIDAEVAATAIEAFRAPDGHGEHRTPGQATADALTAALRAALDAGQAPTRHGVRPHISVMVPATTLATGDGGRNVSEVAELAHMGPVPAEQIRRLLADAAITRIITGGDGVPLDVSRAARTVPVGVWKALVARDGGCTWPDCDAPPAWCDAAHLARRWRDGAGVSVAELGLLCRRHHRSVDRSNWTGRIVDGLVVWRPPATTSSATGDAASTDTVPPDRTPPGSPAPLDATFQARLTRAGGTPDHTTSGPDPP